MACGGSLERAWQTSANVDTASLRVATKDATAALQVIHGDVTRLRSQAHSVIEETRGRAQELRVVVLFCVLMMTSSNGNIFCVTGHLCGEFTGPRWILHKGQWRGSLMFSLKCVWINDWVNNREAGDLRRYRAHYDVSVMFCFHDVMSLRGNALWTTSPLWRESTGPIAGRFCSYKENDTEL